ncbi:hypothetical protein TPA0906_00520 [Streptomyces olivaceus]|uniref:hypothetical protein n=1 Tax=Streptomyces olivaceus TaxID=47716 RepID=UPI0022EDE1B5|nr:hypothetical protein [Streptomyces olivaceus]GHI98186.1 hypothetical protein TPA0906_00520 [Streptomyces olivaceus]
MPMYERTEDGITTYVTEGEGLAEGRAAMLDRVTLRERVQKISVESGAYDITYKYDRRVILIPVEAMPESTEEPVSAPVENDPACEGHSGEDGDLLGGVGIGETAYCDGSCQPRRPRYPFTVMVGYVPTHFNDRGAADRCAALYGSTVIDN